ncbi:transcriptional regulator [Neisseria shayeganii]|nr:Cro/CI family transcriptional regulator [Neisseria shayeganii]
MTNHIEAAINAAGGLQPLAMAVGVTTATVIGWKQGARPVPIKRCVKIEEVTHGAVCRKDLRPDWREIWPELSHD